MNQSTNQKFSSQSSLLINTVQKSERSSEERADC